MPLFWIYFIPPGQVWQKRVGDWVGVRAPVAYMFDCRWGVGEGGVVVCRQMPTQVL